MTAKKSVENFWATETFHGGTDYKTRSIVLLAILPFVLAGLLYWLLIVFEDLPSGPEIIVALAYGAIVLMISLMLLTFIISIIDFLRRFE